MGNNSTTKQINTDADNAEVHESGNSDVELEVSELFNALKSNSEDAPTIESTTVSEEVATPPEEQSPPGDDVEALATEVAPNSQEPVAEDDQPPLSNGVENAEPSTDVSSTESAMLALREQVANLTARVNASAPASKADEPVATVPLTDLSTLVTDGEFETALESKQGFMNLLSKAIAKSNETVTDHIMMNIPTVVGNFVQRQSVLKDVAAEFYSSNPELMRVKRYVSQVANEVSSEHPEWELAQVLKESATRAKLTLGIADKVSAQVGVPAVPGYAHNPTPIAPILPGGTGSSRRGVQSIPKLQSEIDSLIEN